MTTRNLQLEKKLASYTLAGAALLAPGVAKADIIYSGNLNVTVNQPGSYSFDLSGPGTADVVVNAQQVLSPFGTENQINVTTNAGARVLLTGVGSGYVEALAFGALIDPNSPNWGSSGKMAGYNIDDPSLNGGGWSFNGNASYLGFYFGAPGNVHTGWAHISTIANDTTSSFTVLDYAYENTANTAITAGAVSDVPEPSSMALLGLGGVGVLALRRRRQNNA